MSLGSWLVGLGIRAEGVAAQLGVRSGKIALQWPTGANESLIYRLPRDPHQRASIFSTQQTIIVNEGEMAIVMEDGIAGGELVPGRYTFHRARIVGALDIIWLKTGQRPLKWGVGNITTADGIQVSANGVIYVRVVNGERFNREVVQGEIIMPPQQLQRFLLPRIQGVIRSQLAKAPVLELQTQRESHQNAIQQGLETDLLEMGLGLAGFEVIEINLPEEFKAAVAQATMVQHTGQARLLEAQQRAQMTQLEATAAAQAKLVEGMADVQLLQTMQAVGIDPLKLKALEALNTYAANPSKGGMLSGDVAGAQLFAQITSSALAPTSAGPMRPPAQLPGMTVALPPTSAQLPQTGAEAPNDEAVAKIAKLESQIEKLDDKLLDGEISEDYHAQMMARLEAKLTQLKG